MALVERTARVVALPPSLVQMGTQLPRLLREYGHCWIARALFEGSDNFDELLGAVESILGEVGMTGGH